MDLDALNEQIAAVHRGRKWILTPDVAAAATPLVKQLRQWETGPLMVVSSHEGVGELPDVDRLHYTRATGDTVMGTIRAFLDSIERPSAETRSAVDAFDPSGEAMNLFSGFSRAPELVGRPIYGARPAEWGDLEDKMIIDELLDASGIARAPSAIVSVAGAADAAAELAGDSGTVWVADNREGWHGGGEYVRWVRDPADVGPAVDWFGEHAEVVRVMPFLEGIPCSIHGFNAPDGTAVFLPVEMIIFRHAERPQFVYGRAANFWEPPAAVRDEMRRAARRLGAQLHDRVGYLGSFGIDGVTTSEGFRPTELNPRLSVGHALQAEAAGVPLGTLERLLHAGDLAVSAVELEEAIVDAVGTSRGGAMLLVLGDEHPPTTTGVIFTDDGAAAVGADEPSDATIEIGPGPYQSILMMRFDPERNPIGPSIAPRALQAVDLARAALGVDLPPMIVASDPFSEDRL